MPSKWIDGKWVEGRDCLNCGKFVKVGNGPWCLNGKCSTEYLRKVREVK